jgi:succinyl-diaminopimelate desuccinylase
VPDRRAELLSEIERRRDDLVGLTQALIRIPTLNPPGENYREICEFVANRLRGKGFAIELIRAEGAPGDSNKYPRWNVVARREGRSPGETLHFN